MSHGGKRQGAGRKKGSLSKRTQEIVAAAAADGITPLEFMLNVLRDDKKGFDDRFKAAIQAAPYMHPRLAAVEHSGDADNPISLQRVEIHVIDPESERPTRVYTAPTTRPI